MNLTSLTLKDNSGLSFRSQRAGAGAGASEVETPSDRVSLGGSLDLPSGPSAGMMAALRSQSPQPEATAKFPEYSFISGTSMATAHVSGVMGLIEPFGLMGMPGIAGAALGVGIGAMAAAGAVLGSALSTWKADAGPAQTPVELPVRNADGRFRTKSGSTHLETLRESYGEAFAAGLPGNMPLQVLRAATGLSLTQMVKNPEKVEEAADQLKGWKPRESSPNGRARNADGKIRQKRGDTKIETLRSAYGLDFAGQLPGNFTLGILRSLTGKSLSQLLELPQAQNYSS